MWVLVSFKYALILDEDINHEIINIADLKHNDSFGKSENLSKIFFAEILVFDHDYEGKSSSSNGLLWTAFFFFFYLFELVFELFGGPPKFRTNVYTLSTIKGTLQSVIIIKSLI